MSTTPRASPRSDAIRIGTSGWSYDHWNGVLYPQGLPVAKRLARYVEEFDTVELNASFYRWPKDATFEGWRKRLPEGFTMSVKAQRGLTHYRRLKSPEPWMERFERAWKGLGDRGEALLVQAHPELERDDSRLEYFLDRMPDWIPTAMELRHPSWDDPAVYAILERHHAAYVVMSGAGLTCVPRATSDLVYVRMHGPPQDSMYAGSYTDDELRWWAGKLTGWRDEGRRVLVYFNNDLGGHAIRNARTLKDLLGL